MSQTANPAHITLVDRIMVVGVNANVDLVVDVDVDGDGNVEAVARPLTYPGQR